MTSEPPPPGTGPPPAGQVPGPDAPLRVSTLELFFDLVFAFTLTQLSTLLDASGISATSIVQVLLVFGVLWWMYGGYAWLTNTRTPARTPERLLLLLAMAGFLVVGLAIRNGFGDSRSGASGLYLGLGYLTVVCVHGGLYYRVNRNIIRIVPINLSSALLVLAAGLTSGLAAYLLWTAALAIQVLSPLVVRLGGRFEIAPAHFAERHGALVIVALGESVASVGIGAAEHPLDGQIVLAAVLGLGVSAALWWIYFGGADDELAATAMTRAARTRRPSLALSAYFYPHIPILLGVVGLAAGVKLTIGHATQPHPAAQALAIGGGVALFLAGHAAFRRALQLGPVRPRLVTALFALATAALGATVAIEAQLIVLLAGLAAMLAVERRRATSAVSAAQQGRPGRPELTALTTVTAVIRPVAAAGSWLVPGLRKRCARIEHVIERYTRPEMGRIWSDAHKYQLWAQVETLVLEAHAKAGTVPAEAVDPVRAAPPPTPEAVAEVEAVTEHDVIAFLTAWADNTTPREAAAYVHYGMTSSDLLDTALALQLAEATDLLVAEATRLVAALREHGLAHRATLRVGRTHGIHAEPDVWGHRVADFAFATARSRDRLLRARDAVAVGKLSGPVGTYSNIDPAIEATVMPELGLRAADVATQVVFRDGISEWISALAVTATVCEAIALEVRHGQRTEVRELAEPFRAGQKGSSSMPHKKNPIRSERISGIARIVRGYVTPVLEGMPLWHERDISHSSVERIALPDAAIATDYLLNLTAGLVEGLVVDEARMRANLESTGGLIYTSSILLALVDSGMSREDAYALVQAAAMITWQTGMPLRESLRAEATAHGRTLDEAALDEVCRPERYVARLGPVFERLERLS